MKLKPIILGLVFTIIIPLANADEERPRSVLLEVFSSSTCNPEVAGSNNLRAILAQNDAIGGQYSLIKYQMHWPGSGDPYYTAEGGVRKDFNSVLMVPTIYMDQAYSSVLMGFTHSILLDAQSVPSFVEIKAEYCIVDKTVSASAIIIPTKDFPANILLFMAIVEKVTYNNATEGGDIVFFQVMKKFMPDANGIPLGNLTNDFPIAIEQFYTFNGEYRLPENADPANIINHDIEHSVENFNNLEVVLWAQNMETKEVLQSTTAKLSDMDQKNVYYHVIGENGTLCAITLGNPISSGTKVEKGTPVTFIAEPNGEYRVKNWKLNGEITGVNENEYTLIVDGNSVITVEFVYNDVGINFNERNDVLLYPNPTTGELRIEDGQLTIKNIEVYDVYGRKLRSNHELNSGVKQQSEIIVDVTHISSGIYFVNLKFENGVTGIYKFVKK